MQEFNIEENRYRFVELLKEVEREGANVSGLIYRLEHSDFFVAPASTVYHMNVRGGLCQHSLNVFDNLVKLVEMQQLDIPRTSIIIVALLHDIDKMNKYEIYDKNVKNYHDKGTKKDDNGKFDWVTEKHYKIRDNKDRFVYGHHGQNSEYIVNTFIPLDLVESVAIVNHMGGDDEYKPYDSTAIFNRYPLASLLHIADFMSTFITENEQTN